MKKINDILQRETYWISVYFRENFLAKFEYLFTSGRMLASGVQSDILAKKSINAKHEYGAVRRSLYGSISFHWYRTARIARHTEGEKYSTDL